MSVNECRQGKRFKTPKYQTYRQYLLYNLPNMSIPLDTPLIISIERWFSNIWSDIDNPIKPLLDGLQDKYWINDKWIFKLIVEKCMVNVWSEYIKFIIDTFPEAKVKRK